MQVFVNLTINGLDVAHAGLELCCGFLVCLDAGVVAIKHLLKPVQLGLLLLDLPDLGLGHMIVR